MIYYHFLLLGNNKDKTGAVSNPFDFDDRATGITLPCQVGNRRTLEPLNRFDGHPLLPGFPAVFSLSFIPACFPESSPLPDSLRTTTRAKFILAS